MENNLLLVNQNLKDASKKVITIHNSVSKIQLSMHTKSMDFYNRLSLLAGGVLSLSITYIGYLASTPAHKIVFAELLFTSWIALLLAVFAGIYRNHFNLDMGFYQTQNVMNKARLDEYKATLVLLESNPQQFINLQTPDDIDKQIKSTKKNISTIERAMGTVDKKEKINSFLWVASQNTAHISFLIGMILVTLFAAINLPVEVEFSLINLLPSK